MSQTPAPVRRSRAPLTFAILGLLAALAGGGAYLYHLRQATSTRTPEQTVDAFLTAVFANDPEKLAPDVCAAWDPQDAIHRTKAQIPDNTRVKWDNIRTLTKDQDRAVTRARLALYPFVDPDPSEFVQWTFSLVDEDGWRVCDAQPL